MPAGRFELHGCRVEQRFLEMQNARFDLEMQLWERDDGGLEAELRYAEGVLDNTQAKAILASMESVLLTVAETPDRHVAAMSAP